MTQRMLFLCTRNSARSQMAQGLLNWLAPDQYEAFSAGTHVREVHPLAVKVMAELGIDILPQGVHQLSDYMDQPFDLVVTVCDAVAEECPVFPGATQQVHWGFADPAAALGSEEERLAAFRHTRDLILVRLRHWLAQPPQRASDAAPTAPDVSHTPTTANVAPQRVLILCTGNSARSQIAEGWLEYLGGTAYAAFSAGTHPSTVNPLAIQVMAERGIDLSSHRSKSVTEFVDQSFDVVITVCDQAAEACPTFPGSTQRMHWSFPDPAAVEGSEAERLRAFREVRDALYFQFWQWLAQQSAEQERISHA